MPRHHSGAEIDRPEITRLTLPPTPQVVWQQPQETQVTNVLKTLNTQTDKNTQMPEFKWRNDVESRTLPMKETSYPVSGSSTEPRLGNQTGSMSVRSLNDSKKPQSEIQRHEMIITDNDNRDDNIFAPKKTNSQIEDQLVRDYITDELYMPLSSTIVLKQKKKCCTSLWISRVA